MELKTLIHLASEIISYYWPMRTFVHHNPLHGLEDLPFEEGVRRGRRWLGGHGYFEWRSLSQLFSRRANFATPSRPGAAIARTLRGDQTGCA